MSLSAAVGVKVWELVGEFLEHGRDVVFVGFPFFMEIPRHGAFSYVVVLVGTSGGFVFVWKSVV